MESFAWQWYVKIHCAAVCVIFVDVTRRHDVVGMHVNGVRKCFFQGGLSVPARPTIP